MLHLLTNGQGVNADLSHSLKQCTLSQQESLFSAKIELFRKADFKNTSFQNIPSDLALVPRSNGFWVNENDEI